MSATVLKFEREPPAERAGPASPWPRRVFEQLGREPRIGDWYVEAGRLDLRPVDALELDALLEQHQVLGLLGTFYPTREAARAELRRWGELGPNYIELGGEIVTHSTNSAAPRRSWRCRLRLHAWNVWRTERFLGTRSGRPVLVRDELCTRCGEKRTRVTRCE